MVLIGDNEAESSTRKRRRAEDMIKGAIDSYFLHCSICMEPLRPSLMHCLNGHVSCAECWEKLGSKCPVCDHVAVVRSIALEKLIKSFKIPCKNKKMGCEESFPFYKKQEHLENCPFGPSPCPIPNCTQEVYGGKLCKHFVKSHKCKKVDFPFNKPYTFGLNNSEDYVILLAPNKNPFLLVTTPVEEIGCRISLHRINPRIEAEEETEDLPLQLQLRAYTFSPKPLDESEIERMELKTKVGYIEDGEFFGSSLLVPEYPCEGNFEVSVLVW